MSAPPLTHNRQSAGVVCRWSTSLMLGLDKIVLMEGVVLSRQYLAYLWHMCRRVHVSCLLLWHALWWQENLIGLEGVAARRVL